MNKQNLTRTLLFSIVFIVSFFIFSPSKALAANLFVRDGGTSSSCTDWTNACDALPSTLVRGNTYYVADGSYAGRTFGTAVSGTTLITIKKAIPSDHGIDTGWSDTMGDGQAAFTGQIAFTSSNWVFDGVTGGGPNSWKSGFGFKITETGPSNAVVSIGNGTTANNITVRHTHLRGMANANTNGGNSGNDGVAIYGDEPTTLSYLWIDEVGRCPIFGQNASDIGDTIIEYSTIGKFYGNSGAHAEIASIDTAANGSTWTFRYNLIQWSASTGGIQWGDGQDGAPTDPTAQLLIYGNVFYLLSSETHGNGTTVGTWTAGIMHHVYIYNNSFINIPADIFYTGNGDATDVHSTNNLFYNSDSPDYGDFDSHDYNRYINSGGVHSEAHGTTATSGDPFINFINDDFRLQSNTTSGTTLITPYNIDMFGNTRGADGSWDMGAVEFLTGATPTPPPGPTPTPTVGDINSDHIVNSIDYSLLNAKWFTTDATCDLNHDGLVNAIDYSILNSNWFKTW